MKNTLALTVCLILAASAHASPNIIIMLADDMGMGDTSAYQDFTGNPDDRQLATPAMETLARRGVRFTDAHTPSSRCSPTRYGLLTGRYPWRNRLKHWVLFGAQGDPMIERDRPTLPSMLREAGYHTAMVGKWHVGLRYRQANGQPAAGWADADLSQPLHTSPLDHGFDRAQFTSRSHATSGPGAGKAARKQYGPGQSVGPGHIHGRDIVAATGDGKRLDAEGPDAYVLHRLGSRHWNHAIEFLTQHCQQRSTVQRPFFLYYAANANHSPYTPDATIDGQPVAGAARTKSGQPMDARHDYIYENDVALGQLLRWLETHDDPRAPGKKLLHNTLVIFTSDNGAEKAERNATGPFRSNKGSVYEGGHRVPFLASWPAGGVGDGDATTAGRTSSELINLVDLFATCAEIASHPLPNLRQGEKGGEDSVSVLPQLRGQASEIHRPMLFHDHKQATDPAASALRLDDPSMGGQTWPGQWKLILDAQLLRRGIAQGLELYNLREDREETQNLLATPELAPLRDHLLQVATLHRNCGGHRLASWAKQPLVRWDFSPAASTSTSLLTPHTVEGWRHRQDGLELRIRAQREEAWLRPQFTLSEEGLGLAGDHPAVDDGEALILEFNRDVILESVALVAGSGTCGGTYKIGDASPLAVYCVDADIDAKDQSGVLSDLGVVPAHTPVRLDSRPHWGVEAAGQWRLASISARPLP